MSAVEFGPRSGYAVTAEECLARYGAEITEPLLQGLEKINVVFRALVSIMYNCVPLSGHPGGSISSSRMVEGLIYRHLDYDLSDPLAVHADHLCYAAGHKALGLYGIWALRNEVARILAPELLPEESLQLRLEDLLGFRRNPTQSTPLFKKFNAKALDGHPTPATPFVRLATGASGVGVPSAFGLALGALDTYPNDPPLVHLVEGEGGMTPGRVQEAMAAASTAQLGNVVMHIDWNQASIDSERVCRDGDRPGDYVQWNPVEVARLHDFNVILVKDGFDYRATLAAQRWALEHRNTQPTAIVYRTIKGWRYGIEGRKSHGAGHPLCSEGFYKSLEEFGLTFGCELPRFCVEPTDENLESYYWELLQLVRDRMQAQKQYFEPLAEGLRQAQRRLKEKKRTPRPDAPDLRPVYESSELSPDKTPAELVYAPGKETTLRGALGDVLGYLNKLTGGSFIAAAADLLGSTSIDKVAKGFPAGWYRARENPGARLIAVGGICEDAMGAMLSGLGNSGRHIGVGSSYGAFIAAMQHTALRLHGIGQQAMQHLKPRPYNTYIMVAAHAGLKTGEDGPTHADPQCLQLVQENFPRGVLITLTPWDPNEMWPCVLAGLRARPAVLVPFVTRPNEKILDRRALGLPPPQAAAQGVYQMRRAAPHRPYHGTLVLQESGVTITFLSEVLPELDRRGLNFNIYYVSSAELFDALSPARQRAIFPPERAAEAMGITGFTLPTLYRWVTSAEGRAASLHAFSRGHYLGSGKAHKVLEEAGLDGSGQLKAILAYARRRERAGAAVKTAAVAKKARPSKKSMTKSNARSARGKKPRARARKGGKK
jgi:transketolase